MERERERNINVWLLLTRPLLRTWHIIQACALDWELNRRPFGSQACTQSIEPHQPGLNLHFLNRCPQSLYLPLLLRMVNIQMSEDMLHFTQVTTIIFFCGIPSNQYIVNDFIMPIQWKNKIRQNKTNKQEIYSDIFKKCYF